MLYPRQPLTFSNATTTLSTPGRSKGCQGDDEAEETWWINGDWTCIPKWHVDLLPWHYACHVSGTSPNSTSSHGYNMYDCRLKDLTLMCCLVTLVMLSRLLKNYLLNWNLTKWKSVRKLYVLTFRESRFYYMITNFYWVLVVYSRIVLCSSHKMSFLDPKGPKTFYSQANQHLTCTIYLLTNHLPHNHFTVHRCNLVH